MEGNGQEGMKGKVGQRMEKGEGGGGRGDTKGG